MAVSYLASTSNTANATSIALTVPGTVQVGHLILLGHVMASSSSSRTLTWPSGFIELGVAEASGHGSHVAWKIATSSEVGATLTINVVGGTIKQAASLTAYSGTHATLPINQWAKSTPSGTVSHTTPSIQPLTVSNCLKVEFAFDSTGVAPNTAVWTPPSGLTTRQQQFTTGSGASSMAVGDSDTTLYAAASTPGNDTWTSDQSGLGSGWTLGIAPPPTVPSAPQNASATAANGQATVSWAVPVTDGGSAITGYTVTGLPNGTATVGAGTTSTTITGLTNGTTYSFRVHATNAMGNSVESNFSNNVVPALPLPSAPQNVTATAGDSQATVNWFAPSSDGGTSIINYTITAIPSGQTFTTANGTTLTAIIGSLSNGSAYSFTVHATTASGSGPESAASSAVTPTGNVYQATESVYYNSQWVPVIAGYKQIQFQGTPVIERSAVNFSGSGVSITDNPANKRTDVSIIDLAGGGGSGGLPSWVVNVKDYGAVGNGSTDDSQAIKNAVSAAIAGRVGGVAQKSLFFPPGIYRVTQKDTLMYSPETGSADQIFGLTIEGCGNRVSEIFFDTSFSATSDPRENNLITAAVRLRYTKFKNMSFRSANGNNNFGYFWSRDNRDTNYTYPLYGFGQNQYFIFENIEWRGPWNRVLGVDGDQVANNNSEWTFRNCSTDTLSAYTDAFCHVGITNPASNNQQDQFLNWWMENCNWTLASGTVFKFDRGGAINVRGGSCSAVGTAGTIIWYQMNRGSDITASRLLVEGCRFEPKAATHKIIDCNWEAGNVTFISCADVGSLQVLGSPGPADYTLHNYTATTNNRIPIVRYVDCVLAGNHSLTTGSTAVSTGKIIYEGCRFFHWNVATGSTGFLRATGSAMPHYAFRDSWNITDISG